MIGIWGTTCLECGHGEWLREEWAAVQEENAVPEEGTMGVHTPGATIAIQACNNPTYYHTSAKTPKGNSR